MFHCQILDTGFFYADGGAMFGAIPKRAWKRKYPSDEQNCCEMAMRCLLAWNENKVIILDTGVGSKDVGKLSYYKFHDLQDISSLIRPLGFEPEQVTDVVLSHLHFDHCGGCTYKDQSGNLRITFPNAKHWIGEAQWKSFMSPNYLESDAFRPDDLMPVFNAGLVNLLDKDACLFDGFYVGLYNGHTDGQLVSFIETDEGRIIYPSDVIPTKAHYSVDWISAYDIKPLESVGSKIKLIKKIEESKSSVIYYHDVFNKINAFDVRK
ncbi:MAG: MBL fold metallo-hydrolase [Dysgonamonadaceae bacterium]|jgi:glyoxylase-like metal-dependent hydrolase (beta-lactamase superfamily II)|nr:MBL fold metallo-hydrolase [Dysgonamonadaceae bacterium]